MPQDHTLSSSDYVSSNSASGVTLTWNSEPESTPANTVISAVAEVTDSDPVELPPLYRTIETDALNRLFLSNPSDSEIRVSFQYEGCEVTIEGSGEVRVEPSLGV